MKCFITINRESGMILGAGRTLTESAGDAYRTLRAAGLTPDSTEHETIRAHVDADSIDHISGDTYYVGCMDYHDLHTV